jgi:hypothetical protein
MRSSVLVWALAALALPRAGHAQYPNPTEQRPGWVGDFTVLSANVLVSAVSAGTVQKARGGSFRDGFARGAAGGVGVYAGKRIVAERWAGAGLLGRQVASVGSSVVWNAGRGRASLDEVALPFGPVRVYVRPRGGGPRVRARLDAVAAGAMLYGAARPELKLDAARSLSSGTAVFSAERHYFRNQGSTGSTGIAYHGTVYLSEIPDISPEDVRATFAHERIHVLQGDALFLSLGLPAQEWLAARIPGGRWVSRWLDVDVAAPLTTALGLTIPYDERPWEMEASYMEER